MGFARKYFLTRGFAHDTFGRMDTPPTISQILAMPGTPAEVALRLGVSESWVRTILATDAAQSMVQKSNGAETR